VRRARDDRGSALVEFCWVGLILFIPLTWIVISVFEVQRGAFAVNGAARAAARAFALAPDDATGRARAEAVAARTLADQGGEGMLAEVEVSCGGLPSCHVGTAVITVEVISRVEMPLLPEVLASEHRSFAVEARHTVPIGQYVEAGGPGDAATDTGGDE
jgi:Flp pilus assembly protein TadG